MVHLKQTTVKGSLAVTMLLAIIVSAHAEDGYKLWLRYAPLPAQSSQKLKSISSLIVAGDSATANAIRSELSLAFQGMIGSAPTQVTVPGANTTLLIGTPTSSDLIANLRFTNQLKRLGPEGFIIRSVRIASHPIIVIASASDLGALYGSFHFLRLLQTQSPIENLDISQSPRLRLRVLDHWDNLDGSIERGYAGHSLWDWSSLPNRVDPRLQDYARANASIGINGSLLNNVNANATVLTSEYLKKVAAIAGVFRPYGVRVYLSPRFSAPMEIGGLKTADPLSPEVAQWWKEKVDEIYRLIPDFGGFVVKANSEGQPGPRTYN
ncbi:MAG TPA: alpha-glucuronidase family glycosyl hydrolase, partial [Pyrinomonadaceae bacterium]|nr:alpha-glucuronidase family glycosyl hydrolase [Pyrinomonadaceae bacterium]